MGIDSELDEMSLKHCTQLEGQSFKVFKEMHFKTFSFMTVYCLNMAQFMLIKNVRHFIY